VRLQQQATLHIKHVFKGLKLSAPVTCPPQAARSTSHSTAAASVHRIFGSAVFEAAMTSSYDEGKTNRMRMAIRYEYTHTVRTVS
jgi:hypothetical protein